MINVKLFEIVTLGRIIEHLITNYVRSKAFGGKEYEQEY
jgi:hypothetical protein